MNEWGMAGSVPDEEASQGSEEALTLWGCRVRANWQGKHAGMVAVETHYQNITNAKIIIGGIATF